MLYVLTSAMASLSVFLFVVWYANSKSGAEARIRSLGNQQRMVVDYQDPFSQRVAFPAVDSMVRGLMSILPTSLIDRARRWLIIAGDTMTLSQFLTIVLVTSTLIPALYFLVAATAAAGMPTGLPLIAVPVLGVLGFFAPFLMIRRRAKNRQRQIWRSMPNSIDLLTTCVEAGLSLDFALQRVAERYKGPLSEEIHRALRETGLGKARRDALREMAERVDVPDLMTFVNSIVQAEDLGTSVGQVLRVQAGHMRMRRRQSAEQQARRAPAKMVFALVFFLVPSMFIVTIGPVALNIIRAIGES